VIPAVVGRRHVLAFTAGSTFYRRLNLDPVHACFVIIFNPFVSPVEAAKITGYYCGNLTSIF
jgi:hypothetical protein